MEYQKRCVHPESLMTSLFLEGGESLDRNQVEYDEGKEDEYLLGSGLDGFECVLDRSERGELELILRSQVQEIKEINEETQFIVENSQNQKKQSHQQTKQDYNSISNQVIEMMDGLEGLREWMDEDQKEKFHEITKMTTRASNVEEMRDCLELVEGLYEEIPQLIDEERVLELRGEIERLISDLHPHLMSLDPSIMTRCGQMRKDSEKQREIYQLEGMVEELEGYWKNVRNEEELKEREEIPQLGED